MLIQWHMYEYNGRYGFRTNRSWHSRYFAEQLSVLSGGIVLVDEWYGQVPITYKVFTHTGTAPHIDTDDIV